MWLLPPVTGERVSHPGLLSSTPARSSSSSGQPAADATQFSTRGKAPLPPPPPPPPREPRASAPAGALAPAAPLSRRLPGLSLQTLPAPTRPASAPAPPPPPTPTRDPGPRGEETGRAAREGLPVPAALEAGEISRAGPGVGRGRVGTEAGAAGSPPTSGPSASQRRTHAGPGAGRSPLAPRGGSPGRRPAPRPALFAPGARPYLRQQRQQQRRRARGQAAHGSVLSRRHVPAGPGRRQQEPDPPPSPRSAPRPALGRNAPGARPRTPGAPPGALGGGGPPRWAAGPARGWGAAWPGSPPPGAVLSPRTDPGRLFNGATSPRGVARSGGRRLSPKPSLLLARGASALPSP